jgi:hypothetical protein
MHVNSKGKKKEPLVYGQEMFICEIKQHFSFLVVDLEVLI